MCDGVILLFCCSRRSRSKSRRNKEDEQNLLDHELGPEVSQRYTLLTNQLHNLFTMLILSEIFLLPVFGSHFFVLFVKNKSY